MLANKQHFHLNLSLLFIPFNFIQNDCAHFLLVFIHLVWLAWCTWIAHSTGDYYVGKYNTSNEQVERLSDNSMSMRMKTVKREEILFSVNGRRSKTKHIVWSACFIYLFNLFLPFSLALDLYVCYSSLCLYMSLAEILRFHLVRDGILIAFWVTRMEGFFKVEYKGIWSGFFQVDSPLCI